MLIFSKWVLQIFLQHMNSKLETLYTLLYTLYSAQGIYHQIFSQGWSLLANMNQYYLKYIVIFLLLLIFRIRLHTFHFFTATSPATILRLVRYGRISHSEGRLEMYEGSTWTTFCVNNFNSHEADLACQTLGFVRAMRFGRVGYLG